MTIVYSYNTGSGDGPQYFTSRATALSEAQEDANHHRLTIKVECCRIKPGGARAVAVALLMNTDWCISRRLIKVVRQKASI